MTSRPDAERLVAAVLATLGALESTLADETALVRVGKIRDGLAQEERKSELAARYLRELEGVKANAVALARFAPDAVERLKAAHAGFNRTVETNRTVLATARAVSEGLIKTVSDELARASRPAAYGPAAARPARAAINAPLVLSRSL
ncbi:MAG TPA: hypothetical protein VKA80_14435 [Beijerinckiaceae bacterium]|nr:hypothetical protein [Beijerinckiaceae bacterium]